MPGLWPAIRAAKNGVEYAPFASLITVEGTGSPGPYDWGFPSMLGFAMEDVADGMYEWDPVPYPALTFNMGASVQVGVSTGVGIIRALPPRRKIVLSGYSQGSLVTDFIWRDHFLDPSGELHDRLDDVIGIVNFGDPMRCPGICNGNVRAGFPIPKKADGAVTGGIAGPADLTPEQTPDFLLSYNNDGDLYGSAPVGGTPWDTETGAGHDETMIFNLIQKFDGKSVLAFVEEICKLFGITTGGIKLTEALLGAAATLIGQIMGGNGLPSIPASGATQPQHVVAVVEALLNGGMFVGSGFGPHGDYAKMLPSAVGFLLELGDKAGYAR